MSTDMFHTLDEADVKGKRVTTPFRSEKNSNWEGAYRVPAFIRWPGRYPGGTTLNGLVAHEDWLPTFAAIAGDGDVKDRLCGPSWMQCR